MYIFLYYTITVCIVCMHAVNIHSPTIHGIYTSYHYNASHKHMWCMQTESSKPSSSPPPNIPWHHGGIHDVKACVSVTCIVWSTLPFSWSILLWTISHWRWTLRIRTSQVAEGRRIQHRHLWERCWPKCWRSSWQVEFLDTHFIKCGWYILEVTAWPSEKRVG